MDWVLRLQVHRGICQHLFFQDDVATVQIDDAYTFRRTMDLAMSTPPGEESAVDDFAVDLFRLLQLHR